MLYRTVMQGKEDCATLNFDKLLPMLEPSHMDVLNWKASPEISSWLAFLPLAGDSFT